jgi:hypothetical protein
MDQAQERRVGPCHIAEAVADPASKLGERPQRLRRVAFSAWLKRVQPSMKLTRDRITRGHPRT